MDKFTWILALSTAVLAMALTPAEGAAQNSGLISRSTAARILAIEGVARHQEACELFRTVLVDVVLEVAAEAVTYQPMQSAAVPSAVCLAGWDKPDKEEMEAACKQSMLDHSTRLVQAMQRREDFDEPIPTCPPTSNSITFAISKPVHDSAEEAVASLESGVGQLSEGIDFEVQGESRTVRVLFDGWIEGVGDRAAWASEAGELAVASGGVRFGVTVRVLDDPEENKALAIELARRLAG